MSTTESYGAEIERRIKSVAAILLEEEKLDELCARLEPKEYNDTLAILWKYLAIRLTEARGSDLVEATELAGELNDVADMIDDVMPGALGTPLTPHYSKLREELDWRITRATAELINEFSGDQREKVLNFLNTPPDGPIGGE